MKQYISALLIALGLLALGLCIKGGFDGISDKNRVVSVRGLCEKEVKANKVTWPISYRVVGNDLPDLYAQMESTNRIIAEYLTSNGIAADEILNSAPKVTDLEADQYRSTPIINRYNITQTVIVTSENVDLVNKLVNNQGELLKKGISLVTNDWSNEIIYEYTDLNTIKPEMIAEATKNARVAAEKFANDSGSKIGKIKNAQQGQFSITDRDNYTPTVKTVRVVTYVDYFIED